MKPQPRYHRGDRIANRYLVHQALLGGMGEVYLCLDLEENYPYALKTFQQRYLTDPQRLRRAFEQEVATWVALEKHPNIVRCHWMQVLDNQPFMCLEWIAGEEGKGADLRSWLRHGPLDLKLALKIAIDVCHGLLHAQTKRPGLVHRDLKPENILMEQGGLAKITDFGLAQIVQSVRLEVKQDSTANSRHSIVGKQGIAGTPLYMAPEQWRGEPLDERTDIYALGCILYELLTGTSPFRVDFTPTTPRQWQRWLEALQAAHEADPYPKLTDALPPDLAELLQHCLAKTQQTRPTSLVDLSDRLSSLYQEHFDQPPPARPIPDLFIADDYNNRGNTYYALGEHARALADYDRAIELDPNLAQVYTNRGVTYHVLQEYEAALADFGHALELNPNFPPAYTNRGNIHKALGQYAQALADFSRAIDLAPNVAISYYSRAVTYAALQQHGSALADYNRAINLDPNDAEAYSNRGTSYAALGQHVQALADFSRAIDLDPNLAKAYYNRGITYGDLGQQMQALDDYKHALDLDPNYAPAYSNRGLIYDALDQQEEALADFTQAITFDPAYAQAYYNRANTYLALGQYMYALADYDCTLNLTPNFAKAYANRGTTHIALGQYAQALADFGRAIDLDPNFTQAYVNRGNTHKALGQYAQALADFGRAIDLDPNFIQSYYNRGNTYQALQEYEAALTDYTQAITLDPTFALAYANIGVLLSNQGQLVEALPYFEKAAQLGEPECAQYATQVRQMLGLDPSPPRDPVQATFDAFQQADSLATMQQAVTRYPLLLQPDFIAAIEQAIAEQVPPEDRPAFTQRLTWLRQIAKEQNP